MIAEEVWPRLDLTDFEISFHTENGATALLDGWQEVKSIEFTLSDVNPDAMSIMLGWSEFHAMTEAVVAEYEHTQDPESDRYVIDVIEEYYGVQHD